MDDVSDVEEVEIFLPGETELVVAVPFSEPRAASTIKLAAGAGVNEPRVDAAGSVLTVDVAYSLLPGSVVHVFAWNNATVRVTGSSLLLNNILRPGVRSITRPIVEYHCNLHALRNRADKSGGVGPVVAICGCESSNKLHVARSLCNYAARSDWKPLLVDLDCGTAQSVGIPGTIGAAIVDSPIAIDEVPSLILLSLIYFTGRMDCQYIDSGSGEWLVSASFAHAAQLLMGRVRERLTEHVGDVYGSSGAIIILPELRGTSGANFVHDFVRQYAITHVLCMGDNAMFHNMLSSTQNTPSSLDAALPGLSSKPSLTQVDRITESFATVCSPPVDVLLARRFAGYFHGEGAINLHPSQWQKPFHSVDVLRIHEKDGKLALLLVKRDEMQGIVGCISAIYVVSKTVSVLETSPIALCRVQSIDPTGVFVLTTTHYTLPSEKIALVVGDLRWIMA